MMSAELKLRGVFFASHTYRGRLACLAHESRTTRQLRLNRR